MLIIFHSIGINQRKVKRFGKGYQTDQYQTPLENIDYETKDYDIGGLEICNDISSIIIDNENLKRELKLKMVLE